MWEEGLRKLLTIPNKRGLLVFSVCFPCCDLECSFRSLSLVEPPPGPQLWVGSLLLMPLFCFCFFHQQHSSFVSNLGVRDCLPLASQRPLAFEPAYPFLLIPSHSPFCPLSQSSDTFSDLSSTRAGARGTDRLATLCLGQGRGKMP